MKRRGRPPKITGKKITGKKITGKKDKPPKITGKEITGKRRGRPPKITGKEISGKEITGKEITGNDTPDTKTKVAPAPLTREEMEERREKIRANMPKIDLYKTRELVNITKDKDACAQHTSFACHRPDIFLDYGCAQCSLQKHCACPIKDINRKPDGRAPKVKKFVIKPKVSA